MSLKSVWKKRADENLVEWAKHRFTTYYKPFTLKIDPAKVPALKQAIGRMLRDIEKQPVRILMYSVPVQNVPVPTKKLVYINIADVQVV